MDANIILIFSGRRRALIEYTEIKEKEKNILAISVNSVFR
jgi:hypothetical protein